MNIPSHSISSIQTGILVSSMTHKELRSYHSCSHNKKVEQTENQRIKDPSENQSDRANLYHKKEESEQAEHRIVAY